MAAPAPRRGLVLSIDFGTSHTVAVVARPDERADTLLFDGSPLLPSAVYARDDGTIAVGRDAAHSGRRRPDRLDPNPKRSIDAQSVLLGDSEYEVVDLIAAVLRRVGAECARVAGTPERTAITVPASWGPRRGQVIRDAAARAGIAPVVLVPEPVAAAAFYTSLPDQSVPVDAPVVVFDLGAGTFDAAVVARRTEGFEVLAVDGRDDLGGLDLDAAILGHLGCQFPSDPNWRRLLDPETESDRAARRELLEEIRFAKEQLSRHQTADLHVPGGGTDIHLTRPELEAATAPLIQRTVQVVDGVVRAAGLATDQIAGVFLVGGGSRMPVVATLLHQELGIAPTTVEQPETTVARGGMTALAAPAAPPTTTAPQPYTPVPVSPPRPPTRPPAPARTPSDRRRLRNAVLAASSTLMLIAALIVALNWYQTLTPDTRVEDSAVPGGTTCADLDYASYLELNPAFAVEDFTVTDYEGYLACSYLVDGKGLYLSVTVLEDAGDAAFIIESALEADEEQGVLISEFTELGESGYLRADAGPPMDRGITFAEGNLSITVSVTDGPESDAVDAALVTIGRDLLERFAPLD